MKDKIINLLSKLILILFMGAILFCGYKFQEFKLKEIWGIENPTLFQVLDSYNGKANGK